jgi:hypothetical protein
MIYFTRKTVFNRAAEHSGQKKTCENKDIHGFLLEYLFQALYAIDTQLELGLSIRSVSCYEELS